MKENSKLKLIAASQDDEQVLNNLMQFYIYDFSEYVDCIVENNGLFCAYPLEPYLRKAHDHFAYLIKVDGQYAGFVLVRFIGQPGFPHFSIAEFFVMRKFRRAGVGTSVATTVFNLHGGVWKIFQKEKNKPAQEFWVKVIKKYSNDAFTDNINDGKRVQQFTSAGRESLL